LKTISFSIFFSRWIASTIRSSSSGFIDNLSVIEWFKLHAATRQGCLILTRKPSVAVVQQVAAQPARDGQSNDTLTLCRSANDPHHLGKTAINLAKLAATYLPRQLI
jgi:hypothetical protein